MIENRKIETEVKLELTQSEFDQVLSVLQTKGFTLTKESRLNDNFFNIKQFDEKGWNFTRIRVYNESEYEKTDKIWKLDAQGNRVREEKEFPSSVEELTSLKSIEPTHFSLNKERVDYSGTALDYPAVISLDTVVFPDETRYFMECEIEVDEAESHEIRPKLKQWMLDTFNLSDRPEGIGMLRLVMSKIEK